jgi:hypothetical protein
LSRADTAGSRGAIHAGYRTSVEGSDGMSDLWSQILPAITALSGVAMTFGGTMLLEQQKWRRSRRVDLAIRALDVFTDLLRSLNDVVWTLLEASEQIQAGSPTDIDALTRTLGDQMTTTRQALTIARLIGPSSAFPYVDELERQLATVRSLITDIGGAARPEENAAATRGHDLVDAAQALMRLRDSVVSHLRRPEALRIERLTSPAPP